MRNLLVMGAVGITLACATVGGLLGAQGRLNYEGTRNVPFLNALFDAPAAPGGTAPMHQPSTPPRRRAASVARSPDPKTTAMVSTDAIGPAELLALTGMPAARGFDSGELFDLSKLEAAGLTVDDVDAIIERARRDKQQVAVERVELQRLRHELEIRERDVAERHARLSKLMQDVTTERRRVEQMIHAFNQRVTELHVDEVAAFEDVARGIAKLTAPAGAELIVEFWQGHDGPEKVVKILAVMDKDRADEILACLDTKRAREILEKRMTVIRTGKPARNPNGSTR